MENTENTLYSGGTIDLAGIQGLQHPIIEEESDDEAKKQREVELRNELENAFDDLTEDESFQEDSSIYSGRVGSEGNMKSQKSVEETSRFDEPLEEEYKNCQGRTSDMPRTGSVWSDTSDHSGNFLHQDSLVISPTRLPLDINSVVSHSERSDSEGENEPRLRYQPYAEVRKDTTKSDDRYLRYYGNQTNGSINQEEYLATETSFGQMKLLYEARGRELDKLTEELEKLKLSSSEEITSLKHQFNILKAEKESLLISKDQMKHLLTENESRIRTLTNDLKEKEKEFGALEAENKEIKLQKSIAEGTISNLERQVVELQSLDSIAKSRQAQEDFLKKLKSSHNDQMDDLKKKLKNATERADEFCNEIKSLQEQLNTLRKNKELALQEKSEVIHQLTSRLEAAQQQVQVLLSTKPNESSVMEESAEKTDLKLKLNAATKELESYDALVKLGFFKCFLSNPEDSVDQLNLCKELNFDDTNSLSDVQPDKNREISLKTGSSINENLKKEMLKLLYKSKKNREEIQRLNDTISKKQKHIEILQSELTSQKEECKQKDTETTNTAEVLLIIDENTHLKKERTVFVEHFGILNKKIEDTICQLEEFIKRETDSQTSNDSKLEGVLEAIKAFSSDFQKYDSSYMQIFEDLRAENVKLNSKRYMMPGNFDNLTVSLRDLKNSLKLKSVPDSSDFLTLKQLVDTFNFNAKELKEECQQYYQDSTKIRNELWTVRLNLERTRNENGILRDQVSTLKNNIKGMEEDKVRILENCKETYLKYHEENISKIKSAMHAEYSAAIRMLKDELKRLSDELLKCQKDNVELLHEKNKFEELFRKYSAENSFPNKHELLLHEGLFKENEALKQLLHEFESKYFALQNEFKKQIDSLQFQLQERESDKDGLSISDNVELIEARQRIAQLTNEVLKLKNEAQEIKAKHAKEKEELEKEMNCLQQPSKEDGSVNCLKKFSTNREQYEKDFSLTKMFDNIENFKKLNHNLKEENEELKIYYENQIRELSKQIMLCTNDTAKAGNKVCESNCREKMELLQSKTNELTVLVNRLQDEKVKIIEKFEDNNKQLTIKTQEYEENINKLERVYGSNITSLTKTIHDINIEKLKYKRDAMCLLERRSVHTQKYSKLKSKFLKLQQNFNKYKTWREEREKHLISEAERISQEKTEEVKTQLEHFKNWLCNTRTVLADGISQVINALQSIPERALPNSVLEPHIAALITIHKSLVKLDIKK